MKLSQIHIYPIKSCGNLSVQTAHVQSRGLQYDRRWMLVDADGKFVTGRQQSQIVLIHAQPDESGLSLSAPGMKSLRVDMPNTQAERIPVTVWKDGMTALVADKSAHEWLSEFLKQPVRLVYMDDGVQRRVAGNHYFGDAPQVVSFADGYPLLLISQASLDSLNQKLSSPISMLRFRPNLVIDGVDAPHAEDQWQRIRIGEVEFELVKTCTRCVFTTVDPQTGARDPSGEPLNTLKTYRRSDDGVIFGMNVIAKQTGTIYLNDPVIVL
jgi:uncharacterized protein